MEGAALVGGVAAGLGTVLAGGSLAAWCSMRPLVLRGVPILRYRLVGRPIPGSPINDLRLSVSKFEAQVRHIRRRGFVPVTLAEAVARRGERAFLQANPIVLTFDGPYESFASAAWPILCRHRLNRVTLFFPPTYLGEVELSFADGRAERLLSPKALRQLMAQGVTMAVQAPVRADDEYATLLAEFQAGKRVLAQFFQEEPGFVSYSFSTAKATEAAKEAGYEGSCALGDGVLRKRGQPFGIPRFGVQTDTELVQLAMVLARRASSE